MRSAGLSTSPQERSRGGGAGSTLGRVLTAVGRSSVHQGTPVRPLHRTGDPSLPSVRRGFTPPVSTSRDHTTAQVTGGAEDRAVGRREGTCGAVSGKSLARACTVVHGMTLARPSWTLLITERMD